MKNSTINNMIDYTIPEEMREMTEEEHAKYFQVKHEECFGIRNAEKHTIIAAVYKKRPIFIGRAASPDAMLKATEKKVQKRISSYENTGYGKRVVDGKEIHTFTCQYTVQGVKQVAQYALGIFPDHFLSFECLCGEEYKDFAEEKYTEFLSSVRFKK